MGDIINDIHIEILHTRISILFYNQADVDRRIRNINQSVLDLKFSLITDRNTILKLQSELLYLIEELECFSQYANSLKDYNEKTSIYQVVQRCVIDLRDAFRHCDKIVEYDRTVYGNNDDD